MGMKKPLIIEIAKNTYEINEFGMDAMYLCIGRDRALLIDTGTGTFDLKKTVESLCDKPYDVVLTHGHVDHAGGMDLFDEVWICEKDIAMAEGLTYEKRKNYAHQLHYMDKDHAYDFSEDMVRVWKKTPSFHHLKDHQIFDLGERSLEVIMTPGHTPGSVSLLDRKTRILFSGDACNINTLCLDGGTITNLLETARCLKSYEPGFDRDYNGHNGYAGDPTCFSQPSAVRDDMITLCEMIIAGQDETHDEEFLGRKCLVSSYGCVRVVRYPDTPLS